MQNRHLIAALIAITPVAAFAQAGAPGTPPPGGVAPSGATEMTPPIQMTQDPSTGRAVPDTVPTTSDVPPEAMQPSSPTTTTAPMETPATTTGEGAKPKKEKKPRI